MKKPFTQCLALLLAALLLTLACPVVLAAEISDAHINGVDVEGDYLSDDGTIQWDNSSATLTLQNAHLTNWVGVYFTNWNENGEAEGLLTIRLVGENTITSPSFGIVCNADILFAAEEGASLTIQAATGEGSGEGISAVSATNLTLRGGRYDLSGKSVCLYAYGSIQTEGAEITANSAADVALFAMRGDITLQNTRLTAKALGQVHVHDDETGADEYYPTTCVYTENGRITLTGPGTVVETYASGCGVHGTGGVTVTGGASFTADSDDAGILSLNGSITIDGGAQVTVDSGNSAVYSRLEGGAVTVRGAGTVANLTAYYCGLQGAGSVTVCDGAKVTADSTADSAIFTPGEGVTVQGAGTVANLTAYYCAINARYGNITIADGAVITGSSAEDSAFYTSTGDVTVSGGATVTVPAAKYAGINADNGGITITDASTVADFTVGTHALYAGADAHITNAATVTGNMPGIGAYSNNASVLIDGGAEVNFTSTNHSTLYSYGATGNVTIAGAGTVTTLNAQYCAAQATGDIIIRDGAVVTGTSVVDNALYTAAGSVTVTGAGTNVNLTAPLCGVYVRAGDIMLGDGANLTAASTANNALYATAGDVTVNGCATLTVPQAKYNAVWAKNGSVALSGAGTRADLQAEIYGLQAEGDITIADSASLTANSGSASLRSDKGNIVLDGPDTTVNCTAKGKYGITAYDGSITLNAGGVTVTTAEGSKAVMARQPAASNEGTPEARITIGEDCEVPGLTPKTTVWVPNGDEGYYADTLLVPKDSPVNADGLLQEGYTPANVVKTAKPFVPEAPVVTAKTAQSVTLQATAGYEYKMDEGEWQKEPVFGGLAPHSTHLFYQRVAATETDRASKPSPALTVTTEKTTTPAPAAPQLAGKTADSVTLQQAPGCEYSRDGEHWQDSPTFGDLQPGQPYTFYQRVKETETAKASETSEGLTITTEKATVPAPAAPQPAGKTANSVTLQQTPGCEYSSDGEHWQDSPNFENLQPGQTYTFYQRVKETETAKASEASEGFTVTTDKATTPAPTAPQLAGKTANSVTLQQAPGCEYSRDGEHWQDSPTFGDLQPGQSYTFYQRVKETETAKASEASEGFTVTTELAYTPGDVNRDGNINAADALYILRHSVHLITLEGEAKLAADVNRDEAIDARDALLVLRRAVGVLDRF